MPLQPARLRPWLFLLRRVPLVTLPVLMSVFVATLWPTTAAAQELSNVVAVVNGDPVSRKTLADATLERYGSDTLENMINRELILQACRNNGIEITNGDVSDEIRRIAGKFGLSLESYLQLLRDERDITPGEYSREIIWPTLALRRLVAERVQVTQEEFDRAFLSQFGEAVKCRMIMVGDEQQAITLQRQAAASPQTFAALAKQHSEDETSASVGGLIPPIRRYNGDSRIEDAAFALQENQVSPVLQLGNQWIFLQAVRRIPRTNPSPEAIPAIKEQITDRIRDKKMQGAASKLFEQLKVDAKVVKVLGNPELMAQYPGVAAVINGQQMTMAMVSEACLKRNGSAVLEVEINRRLLTQALRKANKTVEQPDLVEEIERAAKSYGFIRGDGEADLEAWMESVTKDDQTTQAIYLSDSVWPSVALKKLVEDDVQLTDVDMQEGFEMAYGPRVEVLAIVMSDQRSAQKIWKMARDNPTDAFFGELAEQYSVEPVSASNRGKVPPIRRHGGQGSIEEEAFKMKPGELSGIIATGGKFIILRCQGYTEPVVTDRNQVKDELLRDITERKLRDAMLERIDQLSEAAEIENFFEHDQKSAQVAQQPGSNVK